MGVINGIRVQPSIADEEIHKSMQLLSTALNEHIKKCQSISDDKTKVMFHQVVDLMLADWSAFFLPPKHLKYKKVFQRALGIQPQLAHFDEESFDIDRHQHDLECLARIALSIKRTDVEEEIRKRLPYQPQVNNSTLNNETKIKDGWVKLKDEGKHLIEKKEWAEAMFRFSQAIYLNSEEGTLYCYRAMCEIRLSKFQLAIEDAEDAIDLNPKCPEFRNTLSKAYLGMRSPQIKVAIKSPKTVLQENQKSEEAFPLLQRAAESGFAEAQYRLGRMLIYGDGCRRNELAAKKWLLQARDQGFKPKALRTEKWMDDIIRHAKSLIHFESENKINVNGLSLAKRIERFSFFTHFKFDSVDELLESAITFETRLPAKQSNSIMKPVIEEWMPLMIERAKTRSLKAQSFFVAHELIIKAKKLLLQNQTVESFKMLREGTSIESMQFSNY